MLGNCWQIIRSKVVNKSATSNLNITAINRPVNIIIDHHFPIFDLILNRQIVTDFGLMGFIIGIKNQCFIGQTFSSGSDFSTTLDFLYRNIFEWQRFINVNSNFQIFDDLILGLDVELILILTIFTLQKFFIV